MHKNHQQATAYVWSRQDVEKVKSHSMSIMVNGQPLQLDVWETTATHEEPGCVSTVTSPICAEEKDGSTEPNTTTSSNARMPLQPVLVAPERTSALLQVPAGSLPIGSPSSSASVCAAARDPEDSCAAEKLRPGLAFEKELQGSRAEKEGDDPMELSSQRRPKWKTPSVVTTESWTQTKEEANEDLRKLREKLHESDERNTMLRAELDSCRKKEGKLIESKERDQATIQEMRAKLLEKELRQEKVRRLQEDLSRSQRAEADANQRIGRLAGEFHKLQERATAMQIALASKK